MILGKHHAFVAHFNRTLNLLTADGGECDKVLTLLNIMTLTYVLAFFQRNTTKQCVLDGLQIYVQLVVLARRVTDGSFSLEQHTNTTNGR